VSSSSGSRVPTGKKNGGSARSGAPRSTMHSGSARSHSPGAGAPRYALLTSLMRSKSMVPRFGLRRRKRAGSLTCIMPQAAMTARAGRATAKTSRAQGSGRG
jgi:hypothetical protein